MTNCLRRDRAAVVATALLQIIRTVPEAGLQQSIENYLHDELVNIERQIATERSCPDA